MRGVNLTIVSKKIKIQGLQGFDMIQNGQVKMMVALGQSEINIIDDEKIVSIHSIGENFDMVKIIPDHPHLFLLAKNSSFILNPGCEFEELENQDCQIAIYDANKNKITQRYCISNSRIESLTAWINERSEIKLSAIISQFHREKDGDRLHFKKSYAEVYDLDLEVVSSYLLSKHSDEEILSASCHAHLLVIFDNFFQTRFFDLNSGNCYLDFANNNKFFWPKSMKFHLGRLDFVNKDNFAVHFKDESVLFDLNGNILVQFNLDAYETSPIFPQKILNEDKVLIRGASFLGVASITYALHYIMTD